MTKIMIVDDNPKIRRLVRSILKREDYEIIEAESGKECIKNLEKEKPDLILLDVMMYKEDGWEVCKKIKANKKYKNIPIAMLTVRGSEKDMNKSLEYGADAHINKPFDVNDLLIRVKSLIKTQPAKM